MGTEKWKLALSHIHSVKTKYRGGTRISKEWGPYQVETQEKYIYNICSQLNINPKIDLFPTRLNTQLSTFASYRLDPKCIAVHAFLLDWSKLDFYAFPPFVCCHLSFVHWVLQKIYQDKVKGIDIAPGWPSQPFYPMLLAMSIKTISITPRETNHSLPNQPAVKHPMGKTLKILACLVDRTKVI